jgi:hypothetical protein
MANTFTLISSATVGSTPVATITISSIPSTYTDLQLLISTRDTYSGGTGWAEFDLGYNGGTTSGTWRALYGTGSAAGSTLSAIESYAAESTQGYNTANTFSNVSIYIPNYTNTASTKYFSADSSTENNATSANLLINAGSMNGSAAAISSLTLTAKGTAFAQYSSVYLYGIKNS